MNKENLEAIPCSACVCVDSQCYAADVVAAVSCQILCCFCVLASRIWLNLVRGKLGKLDFSILFIHMMYSQKFQLYA